MNLKCLKLPVVAFLCTAATDFAAEETSASAPRYFCPAESLRGYYIALFEQGHGEKVKGNQVLAIEKHISAVCLRQQLLLLQVHENDRTLRERFGIPPDVMLTVPESLPQPPNSVVPPPDGVESNSERAGANPSGSTVLGRLLKAVTATVEAEDETPTVDDVSKDMEPVTEAEVMPEPVPGPIATIITPETADGPSAGTAQFGAADRSAGKVQVAGNATSGSASQGGGWDPGEIRIVGISLDRNLPSAVLRTREGGPLLEVRPGEIVRNGWRVDSIESDGLNLRRALEKRKVPMVR